MRTYIPIFILSTIIFSCTDLNELEPVQTDSFIKYFGNQGNNIAVDLEALDDGYLVLGINENGTAMSTLLFKTDLLGNTIWAEAYADFKGNDLEATPDGYFIIGDGINSDNLSTSMSLIKTDLLGTKTETVLVESTISSYHGTAVTLSSIQEIVVQGYIEGTSTDTLFTIGYDINLSQQWESAPYPQNNVKLLTSKSMYEDPEQVNRFIFLTLNDPAQINASLNHFSINRESVPSAAGGLYGDSNLSGVEGDFIPSAGGFSSVFTVNNGIDNSIGLTHFTADTNSEPTILIGTETSNYFAHSLSKTSDGEFIILGSTGTTIDTDFYLTKVGDNGAIHSQYGFETTIGGIGRETGAAVRQAPDGGYIFTGTLENVNDTKLIVLVKVNSKGELKN